MRRCTTCAMPCWMNRSTTVGMPRSRLSSVWLWDLYTPDWLGAVAAFDQLRADGRPVRFQVRTEFIDSHAVDARCAFVAFDLRQGPVEVLGLEYLRHQG